MKQASSLIVVLIIIVAVLGGLWYVQKGQQDAAVSDEDSMMMEDDGKSYEKEPLGISTGTVDYYDGVEGYLAMPKGDDEYPALILIHEWWGLNDNIRDLAQDFAKQGYVALAVDLYNGKSTEDPEVARELATGVRNDMEGAFANLRSAVDYVKELPRVDTESLASVGWCFGGGWSYQMAKNDLGVGASVIYYGQFNPEDDLSIMRADILGHFGEEDASISIDDVREFQATLKTLSGNHEIFMYPNAGHAFANADNEASYVPEAAELSWQRTLKFLQQEFQ